MRLLMLWGLGILLPLLVGCGGGDGNGPSPVDNQPPQVSGTLVRISPSPQETGPVVNLPFTGGVVQLVATVTDPSGVQEVILLLERDGQVIEQQPLTPDAAGQVTAQKTLPPTELQDQRYTFRLQVRDRLNNSGNVVIGIAIVRSPLSGLTPPPPPF